MVNMYGVYASYNNSYNCSVFEITSMEPEDITRTRVSQVQKDGCLTASLVCEILCDLRHGIVITKDFDKGKGGVMATVSYS